MRLPAHEGLRVILERVRYMRDSDMQEWGRVLPLTREGIRFERKDASAIVASLRALRDEEERERFGVAPKGRAR